MRGCRDGGLDLTGFLERVAAAGKPRCRLPAAGDIRPHFIAGLRQPGQCWSEARRQAATFLSAVLAETPR